MKKLVSVIVIAVVLLTIFTGCDSEGAACYKECMESNVSKYTNADTKEVWRKFCGETCYKEDCEDQW